jgi:3-dehydroquinate synthase
VAELLHPDAVYTLEESHRIFALCFAAKQEVMRNDAHEKGPALVLELGHTFGHALESSTGLRHGFAVSLGLLVAAWISVAKGLLSTDEIAQITMLLTCAGIPTTLPANIEIETVLALMREDNKIGYRSRRPGCHVMVILERFGQPVLEGGLPLSYVTDAQVRTAIGALQQQKQLGSALLQEGASHAV